MRGTPRDPGAFRRIELLNAALLAMLLLGSLAAWPFLPAMLPLHFDSASEPAYWSEKSLPLWLAAPIAAASVWLFLRWIVRLALRRPSRWNVPDKDIFLGLSERARAPIEAALARFVATIGVIVTVTAGGLQLGIFFVAMERAPNLVWLALPILVGGALAILGSAIWMRRRLSRWIARAAALDASEGEDGRGGTA